MDQPPSRDANLTPTEAEAVGAAAAWYAKYHASMIAEAADDRSASAMAERERYLTLLAGLEKLGFRIRNPLRAGSEAIREAA